MHDIDWHELGCALIVGLFFSAGLLYVFGFIP